MGEFRVPVGAGERATEVPMTRRRKAYKVWGLVDWFSGRLFAAGQQARLTGEGYCAFLGDVLAATEGLVMVIQDGARYHTSKAVRAWQAAQGARLEVYQLPSYSPDYNPIEHVWRYVKDGTHNAYFPEFGALVTRVKARLEELATDRAQTRRLLGPPLDAHAGSCPAAA